MSLITYNVRDKNEVWATLSYCSDTKEFHLNLFPDKDYTNAAIMLSMYADAGMFQLDAKHSMDWVKNRIVPPDRMNIGQFLREMHLEEYDEYPFLMLCNGRCCMDDLYLEEVYHGT